MPTRKATTTQKATAKKGTSTSLIFLIVIIVLGAIYMISGKDLLGIFATPTQITTPITSTSILPTFTSIAPRITQPNASDGWEVYFTDPLNVKDPDNYAGSIEDVIIKKINAAKTSIHIASYEFDLTPVAEALIAAHKRGVDVRWVTDDEAGLGADSDPGRGQFAMLQKAGIEVRSDDRGALMHDKFWIFDGESLWTGSTNITISGIFKQDNNVIVVHSPEVAAMYEREFQEMWAGQFGPRSPSTVDQQSTTVNGTPTQVLFASEDGVMDKIIARIQAAQSNIRFLNFSFFHAGLADAMVARSQAGVDVAGVIEKVGSDSQGAQMVTLLCAHVPVRQDGNPAFMHNKVIIIDSRIVITGSLNFSVSADESNDENMIILDNADIAKLYLQDFERIWNQGTDPDSAKFPCK